MIDLMDCSICCIDWTKQMGYLMCVHWFDFLDELFFRFAGREDWCDIILDKFKLGHSFKELNLEPLKKYQAYSSSAVVIGVQTDPMKA